MANDELRAEVNNNNRRAGPAWRQIRNACSCARAFQEQALQSTPARVKRVFGGDTTRARKGRPFACPAACRARPDARAMMSRSDFEQSANGGEERGHSN